MINQSLLHWVLNTARGSQVSVREGTAHCFPVATAVVFTFDAGPL